MWSPVVVLLLIYTVLLGTSWCKVDSQFDKHVNREETGKVHQRPVDDNQKHNGLDSESGVKTCKLPVLCPFYYYYFHGKMVLLFG